MFWCEWCARECGVPARGNEIGNKKCCSLEANQSLKTELLALQKEVDKLRSVFEGKTAEQSKIQEIAESLQKENATLTESITALKTQNTELLASVGEKDKAIQKMSEQVAAAKTASSTTTSTTNSTSQSSTGGQANSQSAATVPSQGQCDIKGSNSGIYHVPGSTYYSRTKNVARWFCSTAEAETAGYRAPEQ